MTNTSLLAELVDAAPTDNRTDMRHDASSLDGEETPAMRALRDARQFTSDFINQARHRQMGGNTTDDPIVEAIPATLREQFGQRSVTVAAWSAFLAWNNDRQLAYRFWVEVFASLQASDTKTDPDALPAMVCKGSLH